jgi:hypothetical protein
MTRQIAPTQNLVHRQNHSIFAHNPIGERQSDFEDLAAGFHSRYLPDSPVAQSLLDIAIHAEWILRRLDSLQRNFHRAIKELDRLKTARPEPQPKPIRPPDLYALIDS